MPSRRKERGRCAVISAMLAAVFFTGCEKYGSRPNAPLNRWVSISLAEGQDNATGGLTERDFNELTATLPTLERAVPERHSISEMTYGGQIQQVRVCATTVDMRHLLTDAGAEIADGRFLDFEDGQGHPVIVIFQDRARELFPSQSALDKSVSLGEREFRVVGVLGQPRGGLIKIDFADVYLDLNPLLELDGIQPVPGSGSNPPSAPLDRIWLKVSDVFNVDETKTIVEQVLKRNHPQVQYSLGPKDAPK